MRTVVVVPTYNEADNIEPVLERVLEALPSCSVLVVDDSSPDGTAKIVRTVAEREPRVDIWERPEKRGLGSAYIDTFRRLAESSDADVVCTIDADLSHDPAALRELIAAIDDHDVVVGSRYIDGGRIAGWTFGRRVLSYAGNVYARLVSRVPVRDLTSGLVCFRLAVLRGIDLASIHSTGYAYTIESKCLAYKAGARTREVPITFVERRGGRSKFSARIVGEGVLAPWRSRRA